MVKNIILHVDDKMFFKMREHKAELEAQEELTLTWEEYIEALFDLK